MASDKMDTLTAAAQALHVAASDYWDAARQAGIPGAVIWVSYEDHRLVIVTRGEYREQLMRNIEKLGAPVFFGSAGENDGAGE